MCALMAFFFQLCLVHFYPFSFFLFFFFYFETLRFVGTNITRALSYNTSFRSLFLFLSRKIVKAGHYLFEYIQRNIYAFTHVHKYAFIHEMHF